MLDGKFLLTLERVVKHYTTFQWPTSHLGHVIVWLVVAAQGVVAGGRSRGGRSPGPG